VELLRTTPSDELAEWRAFYRVEKELHEERHREAALAADATSGVRDMREKLRGHNR
jgi:hypothetical protein